MGAAKEFDNSENIILGSGDLYIVAYTGEVPTDEVVETEDNRAGNIKGGATLEYKADSITVKDDKGRVSKTIVTEETVTFKTGLITWADNFLKAIISTARIDTTSKEKHRIVKLGGLANKDKTKYLYRFVHTRDDGRKLRVTVTGRNAGTISLAFNNENATQIDAEVKADPLDSTGTLVILDDELTA